MFAGDLSRVAPAPTTAAMAVMVVARLHGTLAAMAAQHAIWARMRGPGGALMRRLVLFTDSTLDTVHTICSMPQSGCVDAPRSSPSSQPAALCLALLATNINECCVLSATCHQR